MAGNSGAWGVAILNPRTNEWVSVSGGEEVDPYLPSDPVGCLMLPPDGMGVPGLRTEDVEFTHRDGVRMYSDWYENRILTLTVSVCNDGCPGCPTARAKVRELMRAWSRMCGETELMIFTDCHDPTLSDPAVTGPYTVVGRPRQALVSWRRSNFGCAQVTLRFDALDHRLLIPGDDGQLVQCSEILLAQEVRTNLAHDPHMRDTASWVEFGGSTGSATAFTTQGPLDQGFIRYALTTANTGPMYAEPTGTGIGGIPVVAGLAYTISCDFASSVDVSAQSQYLAAVWFDADGVQLSIDQGTDQNPGATSNQWWRAFETFTVPVGAAFMATRIVWDGTYAADSSLYNSRLLVEETDELLPWFSGRFLGTWSGAADASTSRSSYTRRNQVPNPLPSSPGGDTWGIASNNTATWTIDTFGGPDTSDPTIAFPGTQVAGFHRLAWPTGGEFSWFRPDFTWQNLSPQQTGTPFRVAAWVRVNQQIDGLQMQAVQYAVSSAVAVAPVPVSLDAIPVNTWTMVEIHGVVSSDLVTFVAPYFMAETAPLSIPTGFELHISLAITEYDPVAPEVYFDGSSIGAAWGAAGSETDFESVSGLSFVDASQIDVEGDLCATLTIELEGPLTAPIIVQEVGVENGQYIQYNVDIAAGETVTIDTGTRDASSTESVPGDFPVIGDVTGNLSWQLSPGTHLLLLAAAGGSGSGRICWSASVVSG